MDREGINILEFHDSGQRNLLIAAAGHGKTYTISELARLNKNSLPYLILTHTHAGVASLKEKMVKGNIDNHQYALTTIHAFCQSLILAYISNYKDIPSREDNPAGFYKYLCVKATQLFNLDVVKSTIQRSYSGVIIDEYQDCNMDQHRFALAFSNIIPLRALGDPLQCIFDFKDTCVDFSTNFQGFNRFDFLNIPWRWINSGSTLLGEKILKCRDLLNNDDNNFRLVDEPQANFRVLTNFDVNSLSYLQDIGRFIRGIKSDSILIIIPTFIQYRGKSGINTAFCKINHRADLRSRMGLSHGFSLLESIDDKDFYGISQLLDRFFKRSFKTFELSNLTICKILEKMTLGVSDVKDYINKDNGKFIRKNDKCKSKISSDLQALFNQAYTQHDRKALTKIAKYFHYDLHTSVKRPELFYDLISAIESSSQEKSVLECMIEKRNMLRRQGRKVKGKAIGTTLLTKGLEFDTVVVFQADMITDRRNFYVAISRASKDVYLITSSDRITLKP